MSQANDAIAASRHPSIQDLARARVRILGMLLIAAVPVVCWPAPRDDETVRIRAEDEGMVAAIARAQATLDDFLRIAALPPKGTSGFRLKVRFQDARGVEHMWVTPFEQTAHGFSGELADEPEYVKGLVNGQQVTFTRAEISDWGYVLDGKQKGSFTVCVLFKHMPVAEVEQYRRDDGLEC